VRDGGETIAVALANLDVNYKTNGFFDEMLAAAGNPRPAYRRLYEELNRLGAAELQRRWSMAMDLFRNHGITFAVYPDEQGIEKVFPFDLIPRVIAARTWKRLEAGLKQRVHALNLFLEDTRRHIIRAQVLPKHHVADLAPGAKRAALCLQQHHENVRRRGSVRQIGVGYPARSANARMSRGIEPPSS